jgi:VIT1/CCC1 family predicted Fe2+/Mn2+ transporter
MTEEQAHKFVARWQKILLMSQTLAEKEIIRYMERVCRAAMIVSFVIGFLILPMFVKHSTLGVIIVCSGLLTPFVFGWLLAYLRQIRHALDQSQATNPKS